MNVHLSSIKQAMMSLEGIAHRTPIVTSRILNQLTGREIYLKCENFQRSGAFKFRGAYNALSQLSEDEKSRGVVLFSSGNHAQAVSLAAGLLGIRAVNCMPADAPTVKKKAVQSYGGEVVLYDRYQEDREVVARRYVEEAGMNLIPPFDDLRVIAGAGTVAYELIEEVESLDAIVAPIGGGGLISGISIAAHGLNPHIKVMGVEPELANDTLLSWQRKQRISILPPDTIADGLRVVMPGEITFPIIQKHVADIVTVTEDQIVQGLVFAMTRLKIVTEPSGAVSLAAVLANKLPPQYKRIGLIVSGGNLDLSLLKNLDC